MNLQVVYCNHRTAALELRERLAFVGTEQFTRAYAGLRDRFPRTEAVLLSTCNRVELYTAHDDGKPTPGQDEIAAFLSEFHGIPVDEFVDELLEQSGPDAVRHLFEVVSSVDSMVLGEPQIVAQVKDAYRVAEEHQACGPLTNALFQGAMRVSSRVRSETRLAEGRVSVASVAVGEFARSIFDRFDDKSVLVIGAGEMAEEALRYLADDGVRNVTVVNRSPERARKLAERCGGLPRRFDELAECLADADVVVTATGSETPVVDVETFRRIRAAGDGRPVFILDLGTPRDVDPAVVEIDDNVFLFDIDDLEATCRRNRGARAGELQRAARIIDEETDRFMQDVYHRATGPIVRRLRDQWQEISRVEFERLEHKLAHLGDDDLDVVRKGIDRIVNKLLHPPLETLRDEARDGTPHGLLDALRRLFHLKE